MIEVAGPDVGVADLEGAPQGELEGALRLGRERDLADDDLLPGADDRADFRPEVGQLCAVRLEGAAADAARAEDAEQQVLGPDVVVAEAAGLFLTGGDGVPGLRREPLEHG